MPGLNLMNPSYKVFHQNDSLTAIYFRLKSANILYTKKRDDTAFSANLLIRYELIDRATKKLADSSSIFFTHFRDNKKQQFLEGMIPLKTVANHFYDLEITVNDLTRDHYIKKTYIYLYKIVNYFNNSDQAF